MVYWRRESAVEPPAWFIPGTHGPAEGLLARYRPPQPVGAAGQYVRQFTAPGDLVLDLFCQGPAFVREAVATGRRVVAANVNPLSLLAAGLELEAPAARAVRAAFTRLADSPKGDFLLHHHLATLYRTACPACAAEGVAEWFAWDREANYPYRKAVRCPACAHGQEGPTDETDITAARRWEKRGLSYHYALNRAAPPDHPARRPAMELVDLYPPRNLSALMDIGLRLDGLELERPVRAALQSLLVTAFDLGSGLDPHGEARPRPRVLRLPNRYLERNVWLVMEDELNRWPLREDASPVVYRAPDLATLLADRRPGYVLLPVAAREVGEHLPPGSVSLILADPPRPDGVFWALCALWASWLWDGPLAERMRPLLRRRRFDWEWHREVLQTALQAAAALLAPDGHLVTLFGETDEELTESVCMAAAGAGYELAGWGASPEAGVRLVWRVPAPAGRRRGGPQPLPDLAERAAAWVGDCLAARGEPTPRVVLHSAVCAGLVQDCPDGCPPLAEIAHQAMGGLQRVAEESDLYWLSSLDGQPSPLPLADRVEQVVRELLCARAVWEADEALLAVYAALDGPLTPEFGLLLQCLRAYGVQEGAQWRLREGEDAACRAEEASGLRRDLLALGKRLGYRVSRGRGWDVRWRERGRDRYLFVLSPTAVLGRFLLAGPKIPPGAHPCLVFPGGRAELLAFKLARDPRLERAAQAQGWQFVKFRHLRRLIAEGVDRRAFAVVLPNDPVAGPEGVQIPLFIGGEP